MVANFVFVSDIVFGSSLSELCERERGTVPRFVQECVLAVENRGRLFCVFAVNLELEFKKFRNRLCN